MTSYPKIEIKADEKLVWDIEIYPNYFLIMFKKVKQNLYSHFDMVGSDEKLAPEDCKVILHSLKNYGNFGFNSKFFDLPLLILALRGYSVKMLYKVAKDIIESNVSQFEIAQKYNLYNGSINLNEFPLHYDIFKLAGVLPESLKMYGAKLHCEGLVNLPIAPDTNLTDEQTKIIQSYCMNDLEITELLWKEIQPKLNLRRGITKFGDLKSKSDAQITETIYKYYLTNNKGYKGDGAIPPSSVKYTIPTKLKGFFSNINLAKTLMDIDYKSDNKGHLKLPTELTNKIIKIGDSKYKIGLGGLHSVGCTQIVKVGNDEVIVERDVQSYYPNLLLKFCSDMVDGKFLQLYEKLLKMRITAKKNGDNVRNDFLKLVINGTFGKFSNKYSVIYKPAVFLRVVLTGQLLLLLLISWFKNAGLKVLSANTDGIFLLLKKEQVEECDTVCKKWESATNFILEETRYKGLYMRDVNNYFAVMDNGKCKTKGTFSSSGINKTPSGDIINKAVMECLINNKPIVDTIKTHTKFEDFLFIRKVKHGAFYRDNLCLNNQLGNVVRWYWQKGRIDCIWTNDGKSVARSDGGIPVKIMPEEIPKDIDYEKYVAEAVDVLGTLGLDYTCL